MQQASNCKQKRYTPCSFGLQKGQESHVWMGLYRSNNCKRKSHVWGACRSNLGPLISSHSAELVWQRLCQMICLKKPCFTPCCPRLVQKIIWFCLHDALALRVLLGSWFSVGRRQVAGTLSDLLKSNAEIATVISVIPAAAISKPWRVGFEIARGGRTGEKEKDALKQVGC